MEQMMNISSNFDTNSMNYIYVKNNGSFAAILLVQMTQVDGNVINLRESVSPGETEKMNLKYNVQTTNVNVTVQIFNGSTWTQIFTQNFNSIGVLGLTLTGTISEPVCTITENTPNIGLPTPLVYVIKTPDPTTIKVGDTVTVTVEVSNNGTMDINNVYLTLRLPKVAVFVPDSITVDGQSMISPVMPSRGISLGTVAAGQTVVVIYKVVVKFMPAQNPVAVKPIVTFQYKNFAGQVESKTIEGDVVPATIVEDNGGSEVPCCCCCCCNYCCCKCPTNYSQNNCGC